MRTLALLLMCIASPVLAAAPTDHKERSARRDMVVIQSDPVYALVRSMAAYLKTDEPKAAVTVRLDDTTPPISVQFMTTDTSLRIEIVTRGHIDVVHRSQQQTYLLVRTFTVLEGNGKRMFYALEEFPGASKSMQKRLGTKDNAVFEQLLKTHIDRLIHYFVINTESVLKDKSEQ